MRSRTLNVIIALFFVAILAAGICFMGFASRDENGKWFHNSDLSTWHWSDKADEETPNMPDVETPDDSDEEEPNTPDVETPDDSDKEDPNVTDEETPNHEKLFESMFATLDGLVGGLGE